MPQVDWVINPASINPIWHTDEYATKDFISFWIKQSKLVMNAPINPILIKMLDNFKRDVGIICIIRKMPYPPNFRRIAAKIMDPAIGASTCAFGNHRWVRNIGSFTKKAKIKISAHKEENIILL